MRKRDFPPRAICNKILGGILKIKNKDVYFKYISEVRQEDRSKVLAYLKDSNAAAHSVDSDIFQSNVSSICALQDLTLTFITWAQPKAGTGHKM